MRTDTTRSASLVGAIGAAVAASACCLGPLVFAMLGIGGAGALVALEPYRPVLTVLTIALLGVGFTLTYRSRSADADDCGCEMPRADRAGERMLWLATGLVAATLLFPFLTPYLL